MVGMAACYLSHVAEDGRAETVETHLSEVAHMAKGFADVFGAGSWAYAAGMAHDIGKYSDGFQRRLLFDGSRVDHSTAGAYELWKLDPKTPLTYCVMGHHGGMPDGGTSLDEADDSTLFGRLKRAENGGLCDYSSFCKSVELAMPGAWDVRNPEKIPDGFSLSFLTRMVFSCLVDADYLCTERFMNGSARRSLGYEPVEGLLKKLEGKIQSFDAVRNLTSLNEIRHVLLSSCLSASGCKPGVFSLTVPTGGGKTLSSMWFALNHASFPGNDMRRVIYVAPYTSIIEQNARVYRDIFGCENVLEHHSNFDFDDSGSVLADGCSDSNLSDDVLDRLRLASENWDAPIVVTTAVQLFESLYANKPSRCRKLHNIAGSVIVLDEAQMIPITQLEPCIRALVELVDHYGCSVVLCTATQPALDGLFERFGSSVKEIVPDPKTLAVKLKRVSYVWDGGLSIDELVDRMCSGDQALCVVNNRKHAKSVFDALDGRAPGCAFHLSTLMHPLHRSSILEMVRERLGRGEPCYVVSTSLIEAGVDISFPVVYRALAGLDSIVQCAGRCNREGLASAEQSLVHVFEPSDDGYALPNDTRQRSEIARAVLALCGCMEDEFDAGDPDLIRDYFVRLKEAQASLDKFSTLKRMCSPNRVRKSLSIPFKSVADDFRIIEEGSCSVIVPDESIKADIMALRSGDAGRAASRRLMRHSVSVYDSDVKSLGKLGVIAAVDKGTYLLTDLDLYDSRTGLDVSIEGGRAICF